MSTELVVHQQSDEIATQIEYAKAVATGDLLPQAYRGKPANVLIAVGLGQAMGLSFAESLYRIDVIQGKPTAAAELIASNVRRAGHKLRVRVDEQAVSATATIIRADDPEYEHTVTRDMAWAKTMGLASKDNYKKQPTTMLQWRAITAVARMACPEALYGVAYTPDEIWEAAEVAPVAQRRVTAADFTATPADAVPVVPPSAAPADPVEPAEPDKWAEVDPHDQARKRMFAIFNEQGITDRGQQIAGISQVIGRPIESRSELTTDEMNQVTAALRARAGDGQ